jgi:hypothetical protein
LATASDSANTQDVRFVTSPAKTTFGYHWTNDESVLTPSGLSAWLETKFDSARTTSLEQSGNSMGEGVYLASNPVSTAGFGRILIIVPLKPNCVYAVAPDADWEKSKATRSAIESKNAGVLYPFDVDEKAVLLRDSSAFDIAQVRTVDTRVREGEFIESYTAKKFTDSSPWTEAARYYGAEFVFSASALAQKGTTRAPLLDSKKALTNAGYSVALQAELTSGGEKREKILDALIDGAPTQLDFPVCSRREVRFPFRGSKYRECLGALSESVSVHVAPSLATSMGESPIGKEEAFKLLSALGYKDILPPVTESQKTFYTSFFERWKAVRGKATAAEALVKASLLFGRGEGETGFEDWR